jgi:ABC-type cobalamin/Fe3+-siderophores transport system ATPase subunit
MPLFDLPPKQKGAPNERFENVRSMVIVGANGSGKSRMGAWIESTASAKAHRLTAQRALSIPAYVQPRAYEQAEATLFYGHYDPSQKPEQLAASKFGRRWGNEPASFMLSDFEHVLALLFADEAKRNRDYSRAALKALPKEKPPKCKLDTLSEIWLAVMPQRTLKIFDDKIDAQTNSGSKYEARHMSDGERVTVYLIGQALCAPPGAIVIIDEPEIHLHRAIQALLWDKIEEARPDCTFIYITHDLDFAATRIGARKIWLKEFDGNDWVWEEIVPGPALPDPLLFQVLGSRRSLLFVEGDETSYDSAIYTALYPREMVVPRQSCEKVIEATKAMIALSALHNLSVRGLVDRDRRGEEEIDALRTAGVLVADVAEAENLLCLPEALEAVATHLKFPDVANAKAAAEEAVIAEMAEVIDQQALARALAEIQFRLNGFGPKIGKSDAGKLEKDLQKYVAGIDVTATVKKCRTLFDGAVASRDYRVALRLYNCKGVLAFVATSFDIKKEGYCRIVLDFIKTEPEGAVAKAMRKAIDGAPDPGVIPPIIVRESSETASTSVVERPGNED